MKIALVQSSMPAADKTYMRLLIDYFRQRGHRLQMFPVIDRSSHMALFDHSWNAVLEEIRSFKPDLVLEHCRRNPFFARLNQAIKSLIRVPIVSIFESLSSAQLTQGAWFKSKGLRHESEYFDSVDAIVFNSRTHRRAFMKKFEEIGYSTVAYPAGDHIKGIGLPEKIVARARRCGPLQLVFRGDVVAGSGLINLIRSLQTISEGSWQLRVIGNYHLDRSYSKRVNRLVRRMDFEGWVEFVGPLDGDKLADCLTDSHIQIVPFSSDRYEVAVIEGMGYGLPAFCPESGAFRELVQHGINGYQISPCDRETVADNVERLYKDRDSLVVMGLAAWSAYQQHPKWADCFSAIEDLLFQVKAAGGERLTSIRPSTHHRNVIMFEDEMTPERRNRIGGGKWK